jgi:hypothetical protein
MKTGWFTDKQDMQRQERMFVDYCQRNQLHPVLTLLDEDILMRE